MRRRRDTLATPSGYTPLEMAVLALLTNGERKDLRGRTRLQKMAFLLAHLPGTPEIREEMAFEALHFGPFSEVLDDTVKMMEEANFLSVKGPKPRAYHLTQEGLEAARA